MTTETTIGRRQTIEPHDFRFGTPGAREALLAWCAANGVDGDRTAKITVNETSVEFVVYLLNEHGKRYVDETGFNAAQKTVTVEAPTPLPEVWR